MNKFNELLGVILANAVPADTKASIGSIALSLIKRDRDDLVGRRWGSLGEDKIRQRLVEMVAGVEKDDPISAEEITKIALEATGIGARTFRRAVKKYRDDERAAYVDSISPQQPSSKEQIYFDDYKYWRCEEDRRYHSLSRPDALLHLKKNGSSGTPKQDGGTSPAEDELFQIQRKFRVSYAGSFCGRPAGLHSENGQLILATQSPDFIEGIQGDASALAEFYSDLFGRAANDPLWQEQLLTFSLWLKRARQAIRNYRDHLPGQMLCLVGPVDIGKTLAQRIITLCLGGRSADPSLWLQNKTTFNGDLWTAEHLPVSDANLEEKIEARKAMRDKIKEMVANSEQPYHRKHRDGMTLRPIWRITLSANDDPGSAYILPPLEKSTFDKIIYFHVYPPAFPFPTKTEADTKNFYARLTGAIPAFVYDVDRLECPTELAKGRFGVKEFHHPTIVNLLESHNPDGEFSEILESWIDRWNSDKKEKTIGAADLYVSLKNHNESFVKISRTPLHLGHQLRRLADTRGWNGRISVMTMHKGESRSSVNVWTIRRSSNHE
jgi:hypothetical protein